MWLHEPHHIEVSKLKSCHVAAIPCCIRAKPETECGYISLPYQHHTQKECGVTMQKRL